MKGNSSIKGIIYVLLAVLIWAGWTVASRWGVKGALSAYDICALRFIVAGLLLAPVALRRGLAIGPYGLMGGMLLSCLVGAPYIVIVIAGMKFASASHASTLIIGTMLVTTTVFGIHSLREPTSPLRIAGMAGSLIGIVCMFFAKNDSSTAQQWLGHLCFICGGLMWGIYTVLVRAWKADAMHATASVCVFSLLGFLPIYLLFFDSHISWDSWREVVFQGIYQGVLTAVVALILFNHAIRILGASHTGAFVPMTPVTTALLAIPILHEMPTMLEWVGIAAVSSGVFLSSGALRPRSAHLQPPSASDAGIASGEN